MEDGAHDVVPEELRVGLGGAKLVLVRLFWWLKGK